MGILRLGFLFLLRSYYFLLSPIFSGLGVQCRFTPSCSRYMERAVFLHGLLKGGFLGLRRLLRCHPAGGSGYDPVPEKGRFRNG